MDSEWQANSKRSKFRVIKKTYLIMFAHWLSTHGQRMASKFKENKFKVIKKEKKKEKNGEVIID